MNYDHMYKTLRHRAAYGGLALFSLAAKGFR
jgi:hypothetical protein